MKEDQDNDIEELISSHVEENPYITSKPRWAKRRQLGYILSVIGALFLLGVYPIYKLSYKAPSCFDEIQNQSEVGVDCGGNCDIFCSKQIRDIVINWSEAVLLKDNIYDLTASIENPNNNAGVKNLKYTFKVYDINGVLILEKKGETFVEPRDKFVVFEPFVNMGTSVPIETIFEFEQNLVWTKMESKFSIVGVKNKKLTRINESPRLNATLINESINDLFGIEITSIVYDGDGEIVAVGSTYEETIKRNSTKDIFFTWPTSFVKEESIGCTAPADVMLVFDRSGSMGFGGQNPPQPLTSAKEAVSAFLDNMQFTDQVGLVSFANTGSDPIDQNLTSSFELVKDSISSISISSPALKQHTNIGDGIEKAILELLSSRRNESAKSAIVVLTDGVASRPLNPEKESDKNYPENYAIKKATIAKDKEISIYSIGLGSSVNEEFLSTMIATDPDYYYKADTSLELKDIYDEIAYAVCKEKPFVTDISIRIIGDTIQD